MDCTDCLFLHENEGIKYCVRRDNLKAGEIKFPETPNYGCDGKAIKATNSSGNVLIIKSYDLFRPLPWGYQ